MLEKLAQIEARYDELNRLLEQNADDYQKVAELAKERSDLETIVEKARQYRQSMQSIAEAHALQDNPDEELRQMALVELAELQPVAEKLEKEIKKTKKRKK